MIVIHNWNEIKKKKLFKESFDLRSDGLVQTSDLILRTLDNITPRLRKEQSIMSGDSQEDSQSSDNVESKKIYVGRQSKAGGLLDGNFNHIETTLVTTGDISTHK